LEPCGAVDGRLARRLEARVDVVVVRHLQLVPHLELVEALGARGHVDGDELAIGRLDIHGAIVLVDRLYGAGNGDGLFRELFHLRPTLAGRRPRPLRNGVNIVTGRFMFHSLPVVHRWPEWTSSPPLPEDVLAPGQASA
jgi:hypothetical protein